MCVSVCVCVSIYEWACLSKCLTMWFFLSVYEYFWVEYSSLFMSVSLSESLVWCLYLTFCVCVLGSMLWVCVCVCVCVCVYQDAIKLIKVWIINVCVESLIHLKYSLQFSLTSIDWKHRVLVTNENELHGGLCKSNFKWFCYKKYLDLR